MFEAALNGEPEDDPEPEPDGRGGKEPEDGQA
jgi:hypothetical protein